jgi:predicted DNA repair protein MutK
MPTGLVALLDDIAGITKLAAASLDDIGAATGKAGSKAIGVVVDDAAVTPRYMVGFSPKRELPMIGKIALGSFRNKLLFILPAALALSAFAPWALTPLLMIGGTYLCFEGAEKILEALGGGHAEAEATAPIDPKTLEDQKVSGAIRTDFILSAEIMVIALSDVAAEPIWEQAIVLALVGVAITILVYGVVALIVKMDDIGLHLTERKSPRPGQGHARRHVGAVGGRHCGDGLGRRTDHRPRDRGFRADDDPALYPRCRRGRRRRGAGGQGRGELGGQCRAVGRRRPHPRWRDRTWPPRGEEAQGALSG